MNDHTAQDALLKASEALTRIEVHEATCAARWNTVKWILTGIGALLLKVAVFPTLSL